MTSLLLLFLSASPLLHSHLFTHAASTSPPATRPRIIFMTGLSSDDNYDDDYVDEETHSPPTEVLESVKTTLLRQNPQFCHYNPCLENQEPCDQISARTGCLCPGVSRADVPPHAPRIQQLLPISEGDDRGKVEVQWCAPSSVVSRYRVVIEGSETLEFQDVSRRGLVESLEVGTKVCVEAVNSAGHSSPSDFSCMRYAPPESSDHKLFALVIGGGVALLLLLIMAGVIVWKYQMRKKAKRDSADGLGNPSYSREGTL
ncbi:LRRN4 C-terminal-like protein [Anoplopoma fimbria]|uniref:Fibronectin type-III domain-containing protein UNQ728/PRO1410 homolog n=1 Tax=Anoplopoma fimbria TaxID=229290 RepID=C3KI78_ANOFI|nr:LRRN4 C-terminal-like protein [Anoplopoma fimbria]ACQ58350.1 fibronectin type-III domain-containing protein UNQ728/PRO1410 homolog precursor [Anoplopoma fimbria]